jgi:hypothetical protein
VTVAVKITDWPKVLGLTDEMTAVALAFAVTLCVNTGDVLVR